MVRSFVWVLVVVGAAACGERLCAGTGLIRVTPDVVTIAVGQSTTVQYQEGDSCLPTDEQFHTVAAHWTTADTAIVRLDSLTGRVVGRAVGDAQVSAHTSVGLLPVVVHVR